MLACACVHVYNCILYVYTCVVCAGVHVGRSVQCGWGNVNFWFTFPRLWSEILAAENTTVAMHTPLSAVNDDRVWILILGRNIKININSSVVAD